MPDMAHTVMLQCIEALRGWTCSKVTSNHTLQQTIIWRWEMKLLLCVTQVFMISVENYDFVVTTIATVHVLVQNTLDR